MIIDPYKRIERPKFGVGKVPRQQRFALRAVHYIHRK